MVQLSNTLMAVFGVFIILVIWRWIWIRAEQNRLLRRNQTGGAARITPDEGEQLFFGRVIEKLSARVIGGRVAIEWQFYPEFIHRGFLLTGQCRRGDAAWEPLVFQAHQDSGSWNESLDYGTARDYLFTVKKTYHFFFGILPGEYEVMYDQISFPVRKGKYVKEVTQHTNDESELIEATKRRAKLDGELRALLSSQANPGPPKALPNPAIAKLEAEFKKKAEIAAFVAMKKAEILADKTLTKKQQREQIDTLERLAESIMLNG